MINLKFTDTEDNNSFVVRSGDLVLVPTSLLISTSGQVIVREDGKDHPASANFRETIHALDSAHGYTRPDPDDDDDDDDSDDSDDSSDGGQPDVEVFALD